MALAMLGFPDSPVVPAGSSAARPLRRKGGKVTDKGEGGGRGRSTADKSERQTPRGGSFLSHCFTPAGAGGQRPVSARGGRGEVAKKRGGGGEGGGGEG